MFAGSKQETAKNKYRQHAALLRVGLMPSMQTELFAGHTANYANKVGHAGYEQENF